jgi:hypothetical protein
MSVALAERPAQTNDHRPAARWSRAGVGGETTLEQLISGAWEGLVARAEVACPICGGVMTRRSGGDGSCRDCGSSLS